MVVPALRLPGSPARPSLRPSRPVVPSLAAGIAALAFVALIAFDLAPPLAYDDDWVMTWSVGHLVHAHSLVPFPAQSALALVQTLWAAIVTVGHPDQRLLRLSLLPFVALGAVSSYRIARALGADRAWAAIAGVSLLASPLYLTLATSFMTEIPSVALLLAAAAAAVAWIDRRSAIAWCVVFCVLAALQRQTNLVMPIAVAAGLLLGRPRRALSRSDIIGLAALFAAVGLALLLPMVMGIAPPTEKNRLARLLDLNADRLGPVTLLGPVLGLTLMPFAAGILFHLPRGAARRRIITFLSVGLALTTFVAAELRVLAGDWIFMGNIFTRLGFTPVLLGHKPAIFSIPVFSALTLLVMGTVYVLLVHRRDLWSTGWTSNTQRFILLAALVQVLFLFLVDQQIVDRYFLPAVALVIPLLAALASRNSHPRLAFGWAIGLMISGIAMYAVGQQDYVAWQGARDLAARKAYQLAPPDEVNAGYEANGTYVVLPAYDRSGLMLETLAAVYPPYGWANLGPAQPRIVLRFAASNDPRPGVNYQSLAPGRIILDVLPLPPKVHHHTVVSS